MPVVGGFADFGSKRLTLLSREQATHRIGVRILSWLPLAPRVATLVLIHFICELCVTRIRLSQQAAGEACVTQGKMVSGNPSSFQ